MASDGSPYNRDGATYGQNLQSIPLIASKAHQSGRKGLLVHAGPASDLYSSDSCRKQSWIEVLLRSLGLSVIWNAICKLLKRPKTEMPKQAMQRGRFVVFLTLTTHFIPIGAAVAMIFLNFRGYYIGGELAGPAIADDVKLAGLQFAAKLHELMMQASLSLVVVSFIRHELALGKGIPFGAVFGSIQFSSITYLWSKEFVGTFKARFRSTTTKWRLIALIVTGSILFVTVGPSSAIIMRPRLGVWPAGGTDFYLNATPDQIWPERVDGSSIPTQCSTISSSTECISRDWNVISDSVLPFWPDLNGMTSMPEAFGVPSDKSVKQLYTRQSVGLYRTPWTLATIQMSNLADAVSEIGRLWINAAVGYHFPGASYSHRFKFRKDVTYNIDDVYQPITMAACIGQRNVTDQDITHDNLFVANLTTFCPAKLGEDNNDFWYNSFTDVDKLKSVIANYNSSSSEAPYLQFMELPIETHGPNSVGAFISFPEAWPGGKNMIACAIDARWTPANVQGSRGALKVVTGSPTTGAWTDDGLCSLKETKRVSISAEWANFLNPILQDTNRTVFHEILNKVPSSSNARWSNNDGFVAPLTESILSIMVANALANTQASATRQGILKGCTASRCKETCSDGQGSWCKAIMPSKEFGHGGSIFDLPANFDKSKATQFKVHIDINGYAYNSNGTTTLLSCTVLLVYCLMAVCHILFSMWTGLSSQSWDTISEIVALAMQSRPTARLKNTCAGIVSTTIFANVVKIGSTGENGEHLELLFEGDHDDISPLVPDKFYG